MVTNTIPCATALVYTRSQKVEHDDPPTREPTEEGEFIDDDHHDQQQVGLGIAKEPTEERQASYILHVPTPGSDRDICIHIYIYMYMYMYIYICTHNMCILCIHIFICKHLHMYLHLSVSVSISLCRESAACLGRGRLGGLALRAVGPLKEVEAVGVVLGGGPRLPRGLKNPLVRNIL